MSSFYINYIEDEKNVSLPSIWTTIGTVAYPNSSTLVTFSVVITTAVCSHILEGSFKNGSQISLLQERKFVPDVSYETRCITDSENIYFQVISPIENEIYHIYGMLHMYGP